MPLIPLGGATWGGGARISRSARMKTFGGGGREVSKEQDVCFCGSQITVSLDVVAEFGKYSEETSRVLDSVVEVRVNVCFQP